MVLSSASEVAEAEAEAGVAVSGVAGDGFSAVGAEIVAEAGFNEAVPMLAPAVEIVVESGLVG